MKKRKKTDNQARNPAADRLPVPREDEGRESATDFARSLADMFRSELAAEPEQREPAVDLALPDFEAEALVPSADAKTDEDLSRAASDFPDDEAGKLPPRDSAAAPSPARPNGTAGTRSRGSGKAPARAGSDRPTRRNQRQDAARRPGSRPDPFASKEPTRRMTPQAKRESDSIRQSAASATQVMPERDTTRAVLRSFSSTPFEPPREDPSLDELFGPLGLRTAVPDQDTVAVLTPRVQDTGGREPNPDASDPGPEERERSFEIPEFDFEQREPIPETLDFGLAEELISEAPDSDPGQPELFPELSELDFGEEEQPREALPEMVFPEELAKTLKAPAEEENPNVFRLPDEAIWFAEEAEDGSQVTAADGENETDTPAEDDHTPQSGDDRSAPPRAETEEAPETGSAPAPAEAPEPPISAEAPEPPVREKRRGWFRSLLAGVPRTESPAGEEAPAEAAESSPASRGGGPASRPTEGRLPPEAEPSAPDDAWSDEKLYAAIEDLLAHPIFADPFAEPAEPAPEAAPVPAAEALRDRSPRPGDGEPAPKPTHNAAEPAAPGVTPAADGNAEPNPAGRHGQNAMSVPEIFEYFGLRREEKPAAAPTEDSPAGDDRAPQSEDERPAPPQAESPDGTAGAGAFDGPVIAAGNDAADPAAENGETALPETPVPIEEAILTAEAAEPAAEPEAAAEPEPAPEPEPEPIPVSEPEPEPESEPKPEPALVPEPEPEPEPVPETEPEPEPEAAAESEPESEADSWDPLALFIKAETDNPLPRPLSRDTTGSLPTLEELFGAAPAPDPKAFRTTVRPDRRPKKRGWFSSLLDAVRSRRGEADEDARPAPRQETAAGASDAVDRPRQQTIADWKSELLPELPAEEETTDAIEETIADAPAPEVPDDAAGAAIGRPPEAAVPAGDEQAPRSEDDHPAPPQAETPAGAGEDEGRDPSTPLPSAQNDEKGPAVAPGDDAADENSPAEERSEADEWDPLALFGGQADDAELPTWEEFLRARRSAPEPEPAPAPAFIMSPPEDGTENDGTPEPASGPAAEPAFVMPAFEDGAEEEGTAVPEAGPEPKLVMSSPDEEPEEERTPEPAPAPTEEAPFPPDGTEEPDAVAEVPEAASEPDAGVESLTLDELLASLDPEAETPAPDRVELPKAGPEQTLIFEPVGTPAAEPVPERPAGLSMNWTDEVWEAESADGDRPGPEEEIREKPAGKRKKEKRRWLRTRRTAAPEAEPAFETVGAEAAAVLSAASVVAAAQAARPSETPAPAAEKAPVPSADVRDRAAERRSKQIERREPEEELPPEEKQPLLPEEAYRVYAKPLDSISSRLILTGLFSILSLFFTLYLSQGWTFLPEIFSGGTTVYILLALLGLMVLTNRRLYFVEWRDETGLRPGLLLGLATVFAALDCISAAKTLRPPFTVVIGALLLVELWGRYDRGLGLITTVKVLREEKLSAGVSEVQDITKGSRGLIRTKPDVERFMEKLETRDLTDRLLRIYTPIAAGLGLALTLLLTLWLKRDPFWTGALIFLGTVPVTGLLAYSRLFCLLARRLAEAQAALCGYHGAEVFGGEHSILIGDDDVFPAGSLTLNGFKVYNGNPDRIIAYAAAACRSSGSALDPIFEDLLVTHNGRHYTVDNFRFYDSGGIGASLQQDVVLMGSLDFMRRMGVHMDRGARVKQAVYMSLNGELAAVFAVRYNPPENLRKGLAAIAGNRHFKGILVTRTFLGTPGFLKVKFGIPTGAFAYPSTKERIRLSEAEMKRSGAQGAILAKDSFSGFAQAAAGGRLLRSATLGAAILTVLGGLTGLILMGILAALGAYETATAVNVLLYVAAWLAPTLLLTVWGRHF